MVIVAGLFILTREEVSQLWSGLDVDGYPRFLGPQRTYDLRTGNKTITWAVGVMPSKRAGALRIIDMEVRHYSVVDTRWRPEHLRVLASTITDIGLINASIYFSMFSDEVVMPVTLKGLDEKLHILAENYRRAFFNQWSDPEVDENLISFDGCKYSWVDSIKGRFQPFDSWIVSDEIGQPVLTVVSAIN